MKNQADYSKYQCPYSHIEKECGHELRGPEGYEKTYGVWCECGFRGPVFCLDPIELNLQLARSASTSEQPPAGDNKLKAEIAAIIQRMEAVGCYQDGVSPATSKEVIERLRQLSAV